MIDKVRIESGDMCHTEDDKNKEQCWCFLFCSWRLVGVEISNAVLSMICGSQTCLAGHDDKDDKDKKLWG